MTEITKEVGIMILRYAYEVCDANEVPRDQVAALLYDLSLAVVLGQSEPKPEPVVVPTPEPQLPLDTRIIELWKAGKPKFEIAKALRVHWSTVHRHVEALKASLPEPQSVPASE